MPPLVAMKPLLPPNPRRIPSNQESTDAGEWPPKVKYFLDQWQSHFKNTSFVSALLAAVAAQMYGYFRDQENYPEGTGGAVKTTILVLCYGAIFLNIGSTLAGSAIANTIGKVQLRIPISALGLASKNSVSHKFFHYVDFPEALFLECYSGGTVSKWALLHWIYAYNGGILSLLLVIVVYAVAKEENKSVQIAAFVFMCYSFLSRIHLQNPFATRGITRHAEELERQMESNPA